MNVFILTDLEGIGKVTSIDYMDKDSEEYMLARGYLTDSINYVGKACKNYGADKIYYLDGHGGGGNVFKEKIYDYIINVDIPTWQKLLTAGEIDCLIELGSHARAGTIGGFLDHTLTSRQWFKYTINGKEYSELSMHALLCAQYNVPVVAVIGDDAACDQAKEYIPDIYCAPIKKSICRNKCIDKENTNEMITETLRDALKNYKNVSFISEKFPITIQLTYYRTDMCEEAIENCKCEFQRLDARTLQKTVTSLRTYDDLKFV